MRPASRRAIGLPLELGTGTSVARGWADPGLQGVDTVARTLVWSLAWAEWFVAVSVAGGQRRILKYFYLLFSYNSGGLGGMRHLSMNHPTPLS